MLDYKILDHILAWYSEEQGGAGHQSWVDGLQPAVLPGIRPADPLQG